MYRISTFQPEPLHPSRRPRILAGDEIEQAAGGFDQPDAAQPVAIARGERLFVRRAETEPKNVRLSLNDIGDDAFLIAVAAQVAAIISGDLERGIKLAGAAHRLIDDGLGRTEQITAGAAMLRDHRGG